MADIRLKIEVNENAETETLGKIINKVNSSASVDNIVNTSFHAFPSQIFFFNKGEFILPESQVVSGNNGLAMASDDGSSEYDFIFNDFDELDNVDRLSGLVEDETDPQEFIWGIVPSNKEYTVTLTFSNATSLKDIVILGDTVANQFPTEAIIDGTTTIYSDDPKWVINLGTESSTHTIQFTKWNRANYNACLAWIRVTLKYLDLDKGWIDKFESNAQSTGDASAINYGVLANSGSADIRDLDGELQDLIVDGVLPVSQVPIEVYVNGNKIQEHITNDSDYEDENKILNMPLTNKILKWDKLSYNGRDLTKNENAFTIFSEIMTSLGFNSTEINNMTSKNIVYGSNNLVGTVKQYLQSITIPYSYLVKDSYIKTINKICELAQLYLYFDNNNNPILLSARPTAIQSEINNGMSISKALRIDNLKKSIILKNKYDGVDISENLVTMSRENDVKLDVNDQTNTNTVINSKLYKTDSYACKHVRADVYYSTGSTNVPKKNNYSLDEILNIKPALFDYSINYENKYVYESDSQVYTDQAIAYLSNTSNPLNFNDLVDATTHYYSPDVYTESGKAKIYEIPNLGDTYASKLTNSNKHISFGMRDSSYSSVAVSFDDNSNITVVDNGDYFTVNYNVLSKLFIAELASPSPQEIGDTNWYFAETSISSIVLDIYGDKYIISVSEISASTSNVETANCVARLNNNELQQTDTKTNGVKITTQIKNNILSDYANGVSVAKIDVFCGDLYNSSNTKVKDWSQGEILDVGDVVYFDDDLKADQSQRYWRVTGRKFKYEGAPTLSLELQEIVSIVQNS